jgi:hypothetical protein
VRKNPRKAKDNRFVRVKDGKGRRTLRVVPGLETGNVVTERTVEELARLVELARRGFNG